MVRCIMSLVLMLLLLVLPWASASAEGPGDFVVFETRLETMRREHHLPGLAAAAVVRDGRLAWSKGYGFADEDQEVPITPDTPFWIASVTKTFLGLLFLQLESEGKVRLDDRINDVPEWSDLCGWLAGSQIPFGKDLRCNEPITIRNILQHTVNGKPGTRFLYNPIASALWKPGESARSVIRSK